MHAPSSSSPSSLEITVLSAEGPHNNDDNVFATVSFGLYNHAGATDGTSTSADHTKGLRNQKLHLRWRSDVKHVRIEVKRRRRLLGGNVTVGTVDIPVSDFGSGFGGDRVLPPNHLHFLSYLLRDRRGRRRGIVNLSLRLLQP